MLEKPASIFIRNAISWLLGISSLGRLFLQCILSLHSMHNIHRTARPDAYKFSFHVLVHFSLYIGRVPVGILPVTAPFFEPGNLNLIKNGYKLL